MAKTAGYSGTPLIKKLGIRPGHRVKVKNPPADFGDLLGTLPDGVQMSSRLRGDIDVWHFFTRSRSELERQLPRCIDEIRQDGMIWISWPKKSSGVPSDVTEDVLRTVGLPLGIVDVKVCAVDETWSGLKFVIRKANRR